jgi:hypothetical protein
MDVGVTEHFPLRFVDRPAAGEGLAPFAWPANIAASVLMSGEQSKHP